MTEIHKGDVYAGIGNNGEYVEVKKRPDGRLFARTVELFVYGPDRTSPWRRATYSDLARSNAPAEWDHQLEPSHLEHRAQRHGAAHRPQARRVIVLG